MNAVAMAEDDRPHLPGLTPVPGLEALTCDRHLAVHLRELTPEGENGDPSETLLTALRFDAADEARRCICGKAAHWRLRTLAVIR